VSELASRAQVLVVVHPELRLRVAGRAVHRAWRQSCAVSDRDMAVVLDGTFRIPRHDVFRARLMLRVPLPGRIAPVCHPCGAGGFGNPATHESTFARQPRTESGERGGVGEQATPTPATNFVELKGGGNGRAGRPFTPALSGHGHRPRATSLYVTF